MTRSLSPPQEPVEAGQILKSKPKISRLVLIPVGLVLAGVGVSTWYFLSYPKVQPLQVSGRIEGYETDIGAKVAGRVESVAVREGDAVSKSQDEQFTLHNCQFQVGYISIDRKTVTLTQGIIFIK